MKRALLRTALRREVVGLARIVVIILAIFLLLLEFGLKSELSMVARLDLLNYGLVCAAAFVTLGSLLRNSLRNEPQRKAEVLWFLVALFLIFGRPLGLTEWAGLSRWPYLVFLLLFVFIEFSRLEIGRNTRLFNPALLFTASFILVIAIGTALFLLPNASTRPLSITEALFTATSAVCVTGLSVIDVSQDLTRGGQWLLMLLFQLGGLGVMTFTSFFAFFFKGRSSLEEQLRIRDIANTSLGSARSFIIQVILFTLGLEAVGALFVFLSTPADHFTTFGEHVFFSAFHAVSAFNNAGFSTWGNGLYNDLLRFNYPLMWVLALLIIFGGLGFGITFNFSRYLRYWTVEHVRKWITGTPCRRYPREVTVSSRLVLTTTVLLLTLGCAVLVFLEWGRADIALHDTWGKITVTFFTSAASRTAGFNVIDFNLMSMPAIMVVMLLMYVGGSPGSTAGGIKTTTFALATLNIFATARGRKRVEFAGREISNLSMRRAFATIVLSLIFLGLSVTVVASLEPETPLLPIAFECFSAFATVGQSMGITAALGEDSRLFLVVVMFVGRVSGLTLLVSLLRQVQTSPYRYPKEDILIN
ncbi:MAG: hypothetical protein JNM31_12080 [Flavobacteriales bacterium]|nr:hypothetical protein [Flavobacteriales bacterium]